MKIFSVGHSTLSYEGFFRLLKSADITAVADVRSVPFSRYTPHFNQDSLREQLKLDQIAYVFLGAELGGRPSNSQYFCDGVADYDKMAKDRAFLSGLDRIIKGAANYRLALMCSEHNPLDCHRCLLVGRALQKRGHEIKHIKSDGNQLSQLDIEGELLSMAGDNIDQSDFLVLPEERLARAYRDRSLRVAYSDLSLVNAAG